ncbi:MAG TPA: hypothetical protein VFV38_33830 [Ktedonobacteraceae bacterium]|nr:hypothetical protein [Ktedonobacteraceae bacterium]
MHKKTNQQAATQGSTQHHGFKFVKATQDNTVYQFCDFPTTDPDRDVGVYIRQSKKGADDQHGESRATQLALLEYAEQLLAINRERNKGRGRGKVRPYDEGAGQSGQKRIDERAELSRLYTDCKDSNKDGNRGIGILIGAKEDRFFRDKYGDQSGQFAKMAAEHDIILVIPPVGRNVSLKVYDFSNPQHLRIYKQKMQEAADYIENHIGYMVACNRKKAARGCYDGRNLPPGLTILRKVDKSDQKPVLYEPWAQVMRKLFLQLQTCDWNVHKLCRDIENMPYLFPDPSEEDRKMYYFPHHLTKVTDGYTISNWETVRNWVLNIHLIGWWLIDRHCKEVLVDNHPAVIERALFEEGYIRLTGYTLEGQSVPDLRVMQSTQVRRGLDSPVALLHGRLTSPLPGVRFNIHRQGPLSEKGTYDRLYYLAMFQKEGELYRKSLYSIYAPALDQVLVRRLGEFAEQDMAHDMAKRIKERLKQVRSQQLKDTVSLDDQIKNIDSKLTRLRKRLVILTEVLDLDEEQKENQWPRENEEDDEEAKAIKAIGTEIRRLAVDKQILTDKKKKLALIQESDIERYYGVLENFHDQFPKLTLEEQQKLIGALAKSIDLEELSPHWLKLTIQWSESLLIRPDVCLIWRSIPSRSGGMQDWEREIMLRHYPSCQNLDELLQQLPNRTLGQIYTWASKGRLGLKREISSKPSLPNNLCWNDVQVVGDKERALQMARQAEAEQIKQGKKGGKGKKSKEQTFLYPFWLFPANLALAVDEDSYEEKEHSLARVFVRPVMPALAVE